MVGSTSMSLYIEKGLIRTETNWESCQTEKPRLSGTENAYFTYTLPQSQKCQVGLTTLECHPKVKNRLQRVLRYHEGSQDFWYSATGL